jgi:hypothetical protein
MQPITQASLDPKFDGISHLRADQEFSRMIGYFDLITAEIPSLPV